MLYQHPEGVKVTTMKTGIKIYVTEAVYSVLCEDGKRRLRSEIKGFASKEEAINYVDSLISTEEMKLKIAQVTKLEQHIERVNE